eukprot:TRINITY_DN2794_c0_g1_i1.p1 TRINITY_DN2794_c0_g1~~TRINITY_DN2794_c0_g1_i1.p1  ORF type:complete len:506 (+),score=171.75 TRINITY_DN2794_c0_g1_i1:107-1624(+)
METSLLSPVDNFLLSSDNGSGDGGDLNEIINGLDMSGVDELDLSQFLNDSSASSHYFERDLSTTSANDPFTGSFFVPEQTGDIIKPLVSATSYLPASSVVWNEEPGLPQQNTSQSFAQYWGQKRSFDTTPNNITNMELPQSNLLIPKVEKGENVSLFTDFGAVEYGFSALKNNNAALQALKAEREDGDSKKRKMGTEEKAAKRKEQTRAASKLYRQRRKKLEVELSERLERLEEEKKQLINEKKAADALLEKLKDENSKLRTAQKSESEETAKKRYELLVKLQKQVSEAASDDALCQTIQEVKSCCRNCQDIGRCNLQSIINPGSVQQLVSAGFFNNIKLDLEKKGTIEEFVSKMRLEIGKMLSAEQQAKIEKAVTEHNENLQVVLAEREAITNSITKSFEDLKAHQNVEPCKCTGTCECPPASDVKEYKEVVTSLEHLRKNLGNEAALWMKTFEAVVDDTLTPLQMAHFFLKVEFQHRSVVQLNTFWAALNKTINGTKLCPGVG